MKGILKKRIVLVATLLVILLVVGGLLVYYFLQYQQSQQILKNPTLAAQIEQTALVAKVGQLMDLPKNEQPTIATVSDITKLKNQPFFAKAKNGYKVLIYTNAKEAILYDPVSNKIVEVAPLNIGQPNVTPSIIKIALYNGTTTVGLTTKVENDLKTKASNVTVVQKSNASRGDYPNTVVVDLTGKNAQAASQLAQLLKGQTGNLPDGEVKPTDADLLVILGNEPIASASSTQ